ncbi:hypothetical protein YSA_10857 [Pseudomonas putida ND6]|uniref:Uncharacterized protein n=1 Tax=Pseudomonas putida ND6 TaxID=231023 RepID=I3V4I8_PSEPU|nr:hypothetical protein YSA_10857 [Pseudomonas putida ND6]
MRAPDYRKIIIILYRPKAKCFYIRVKFQTNKPVDKCDI